VQAARALDRCVDVVSIQHEPGIWGGPDGAFAADFISALRLPAVATLHTVPQQPTDGQRRALGDVLTQVAATIVMSTSAAALVTNEYGVDPRHLEVIPHGVPDLPMVDPETMKPGLDVAGRAVILSFGLLGPDKGYELAIDALPRVVAANPTALYVIVGATHPDLVVNEGEAYRETLVARVRQHGMQGHVRFVDRFVGRVELTRWLQAADVFVTPYPNLDQTVSGTLSYAMGAGRTVVSTPYAYARELLADGRGVLVEPGSPSLLATALNEVLGDADMRSAIGHRAYDHTRRMVWSEVGAEYQRVLGQAVVGGGAPAIATRAATLAAIHA
jgi:glycosyltransferase involved in cell wall biosynthesis